MCKEDVRIKRKTATRSVLIDAGTTPNPVLPANPERVALVISMTGAAVLSGAAWLVAGPRAGGGNVQGIVGVTGGNAADRVTIEQVGLLLIDEIHYAYDASVSPFVMVTEVFFYQEMGQL